MWFVGPVAVVGVGIRKSHFYVVGPFIVQSLWPVGRLTNERLQRFTLHIKWAGGTGFREVVVFLIF